MALDIFADVRFSWEGRLRAVPFFCYVNDNENSVLVVHRLAAPNLKNRPRTRTRIAGGLALEPKVRYSAFGE